MYRHHHDETDRETPHPVTGILKGYDQLLNLVLDDVTEELQRALIQGFDENSSSLTLSQQCQNPTRDLWV